MRTPILKPLGLLSMFMLTNAAVISQPVPDDVSVFIVGPPQASPGEEITYKIYITNTGPATATDVTLTIPSIANFIPKSISCLDGTSSNGGNSECPPTEDLIVGNLNSGIIIPKIPNQGAVRLTLVGDVAPALLNYTELNLAAVIDSDIDVEPGNNSKTCKTIIHDLADGQTSVYYFDNYVIQEAATANGGTYNIVFELFSGPPVPGLGTTFSIPLNYSQMVNVIGNGVSYEWESTGQVVEGGDILTYYTAIIPKTAPLFSLLPPENRASYIQSYPNSLDTFMRNILNDPGGVQPLGMFNLTFGEIPAFPPLSTIHIGKSGVNEPEAIMYSRYGLNFSGNELRSGTYTAPIAQLETTSDYTGSVPLAVPFGEPITFRFTAVLHDEEDAPTSILAEDEFVWANFGTTLQFFTPNVILPATIEGLTVKEKSNTAVLQWMSIDEYNLRGFSILRSVDGKNWDTLAFVPSKGDPYTSNGVITYTYTDVDPIKGYSYYRLGQVEADGHTTFSQIRSFRFLNEAVVKLTTNPVIDKVQLQGLPKGGYLAIYSTTGSQVVPEHKIMNVQEEISAAHLPAGQYFIKVKSLSGFVTVIKMIKM